VRKNRTSRRLDRFSLQINSKDGPLQCFLLPINGEVSAHWYLSLQINSKAACFGDFFRRKLVIPAVLGFFSTEKQRNHLLSRIFGPKDGKVTCLKQKTARGITGTTCFQLDSGPILYSK